MNRPPPQGNPNEPPTDAFRAVRRPTPPPRLPPVGRPVQRPPDNPWYLQRPNRPPPVPPEKPTGTSQTATTPDLTKFIPWLLLGAAGLAVLIGAVVLVGILRRGTASGTVLDVSQVQAGVLQTLSDPASGYGANSVSDVSCNGGRNPSARQGTTFSCDATVNGASRHVTVLISDDHGTYEIDSPR